MLFAGKTVFITGGSHGIGRGLATRFAEAGADIAFNYGHDDQGARETVREVEATGRRALALKADMRCIAEVRAMMVDAAAQLGPLDILVNNAGVEHKADFWDVTEADYDFVLDVNLKGLFFATQEFVRQLRRAARPGKVVNISSVHEDRPFPGFSTYCASKGGVRMLTRDLAVELGPLGITVNSIAPGAIATPINSNLLNHPELVKALEEQIPLGRLGCPKDVAAVALFLASEDTAYVTGATYVVDGGLVQYYKEQ